MRISRRSVVIGGVVASAAFQPLAQAGQRPSPEYLEYPYTDYFNGLSKGPGGAPKSDVNAAIKIANSMPYDDHYKIMLDLAAIKERGSTNELFNERWKTIGNPLIVKFFHDIGYRKTPYPGDCTPWCAATVSWCLQRSGKAIAKDDPASSQSYLTYGTKVDKPAVGDLCVFTDIDNSSHGHVGLYVSHTLTTVTVLGGNQAGGAATQCGPGYRQSKITHVVIPINTAHDPNVGVHYLAAYVRPS